jgi:two-component system, NarL family, sensor kinase
VVHVTDRPRVRRPEVGLVALFVAISVLVTAGLALGSGALARQVGRTEAAGSAEQLAETSAGAVVAPLLTAQLRAGATPSVGALNSAVARLRGAGPVLTVTVRDGSGALLWTDDPGAGTAQLGAGQRVALRRQTAVTDATAPDAGPWRVWVGVRDATGTPVLVEVTGRRDAIAGATRSVWTTFVPVALGAVLLLVLLQLPVVLRLARLLRRQRRAQAELRTALGTATVRERRRIAREVHDDVLPELTGLVYELDAARLGPPGQAESGAVLGRAAEGLRSAIRRLRALLVDLHHDRRPEEGLRPALDELVTRMGATGIQVRVDAPDVDQLPAATAEVLHRCVQEALRNVAAHSGAEEVEVVVAVTSVPGPHPEVTLTVDDDGRGFERSSLAVRSGDGHLGLQALGALVADSGGSVTALSSPGQGTRLVVRMPVDAAADEPVTR